VAVDAMVDGGANVGHLADLDRVDAVRRAHPAVIDAALIGLPDTMLGEEPAAVVQLAPGARATEEELRAWVRDRLAIFKTPVRVAFLDAPLPRNANGKILKGELKRLFA
jgi:long-chain acyl-CoA synthetase